MQPYFLFTGVLLKRIHAQVEEHRLARPDLDFVTTPHLQAHPLFTRTFRWERAMAQYETGHIERVAEMGKTLAAMPGLHIIGNSFHGIGVPDCIKSARQAVEQITSCASQPAPV